jgi:riboflavin kinase/FMN adenylyltransferase
MTKKDITSVAIGGFDGMHLGHQELFRYLDNTGAIIVIETNYANLTPQLTRKQYTHYPIFYYQLKEIKHLTGKQFVSLLEKEYPLLKKIVVGYDFHFGANRKYSFDDLKQFFSKEIVVVDEVSINNISIHSKTIRNFLNMGMIQEANLLLGREYKICGNHIKGQGLGRLNFVPTINMQCDNFLLPQNGVYTTKTIINNRKYCSITFIGYKNTTNKKFAIETHIINQEIKKITSKVEIKFLKKIRNNKKFTTFGELKQQISKDIKIALCDINQLSLQGNIISKQAP